MQGERAILEITKRRGYRVEKLGGDRYRLINKKLRAVMYLFDDVPLQTIASHFEERRVRNSHAMNSRAKRIGQRRR